MTDLEIGTTNATATDNDIPSVSQHVTDRHEEGEAAARPPKGKTASKYREKTNLVLKAARQRATRGLGWFWKDMRKSHLLWVKVIFLFQSASLVSLYPYLTIHMR